MKIYKLTKPSDPMTVYIGLTSKEYKEKYNIPDYTGPKTI